MIEETAEKQNVYVFRLCVYSPIVETLKSQNRYRQKRALSEVYGLCMIIVCARATKRCGPRQMTFL